jgi:hypothetical protein
MTAQVSMSSTTAEALMFFLAERAELWARVAEDFGVSDPAELPRAIAEAYKKALQRKATHE